MNTNKASQPQNTASPSDGQQSPRLLDQVRERLRFKHYSLRTEEAYAHWIKRFIFFHKKRHPKEMGAREVTAFLSHLAVAGKADNRGQTAVLRKHDEF